MSPAADGGAVFDLGIMSESEISLRYKIFQSGVVKFFQKHTSSAQIPKPPRKIERPKTTMNHISLRIASFLCTANMRSAFVTVAGSTNFCGAVAYFVRRDGRMLTSMTYIDRKSTTAVISAKAFWWKAGSCR